MRRNILCSGIGLSVLAAGLLSSVWTMIGISYYVRAVDSQVCDPSTDREIMLVILLSLVFAAPMLTIIVLCVLLKLIATIMAYKCPRAMIRCKRKFYGRLY